MKGRFLPIIAAVLFTLPAWGQLHYSEINFPPLPDFNVPEAERLEMENGMVVYLIEDHKLPLVRMRARIGAGSVQDPSDKVGLASITGDVMRTGGTHNMPGDELNETLENIAASVETSFGSRSGSASMSTLVEHTDEVLAIYTDVLMNPAFPEEKIALSQNQGRSAISRRNDDAQSIAFREFDELIFGSDHPLARSPEYATLDAIEQADLMEFHRQYVVPNNIILGVWGDFEMDAMVAKLEKAFGDWPSSDDFERPAPPESPEETLYGVNLVAKDDVTQSSILLGHIGEVQQDDPDYPAVTVMNQVLSGGFSSRLFQNVRDDQGLAYSVFGAYTAPYDRNGDFYAGVMTKSESTVQATRSVLHEIERLREEPPTAEEILQAKDSYLNSFVFRFDTRSEIVSRMMTYEYYGYPADFLDQVKSGIEAVTADDVHRVAEKYLKPDQVQILAVGNPSDFDEPLSVLGEVTEIDITIPTNDEPAPEATEETLSAGRSLLEAAIEASGGQDTFDQIQSIRATYTQSVMTPDNMDMSMDIDRVQVFPDRLLMVQRLPMGEMRIVKNGDDYIFPDMIPAQMHANLRTEVESSLWRDLVTLFKYADQLEVQQLEQDEVDGRTTEVLLITPPGGMDSFELLIDAETMMPAAVNYTTSAMGMGAPTATTEIMTDFREVAPGVTLPFVSHILHEGVEGGTITVTTMEFNSDIDEESTFQ